jgi:hypothetical protein
MEQKGPEKDAAPADRQGVNPIVQIEPVHLVVAEESHGGGF